MKMTDFADVEWDADATTTTDMMIQSLFHPPLARKKRKKLCSKVKKSFDGAAAENHITKDKKSSKKEKTPRKRKLKADDKSENNNLGKQTEIFVDNVTETSQKKDETPQISVRGDHIPRKIRKNKYYTLSLAQRSTKCDVTVKDKNPIILNNDPGLSKSLNCTKVKRKLNKSICETNTILKSTKLSKRVKKEKKVAENCFARSNSSRHSYGDGEDKISSVEKTVEDKSSVRDDCNLFREMCHRDQKAKRKLTATQVTEKCQDDYMRMQKQNTKKQRPKHVKTTKKSLFNITRLREVLSDDKDIPQNDTGALPSHGTKQAEKLNTFVNKEPKSLKDRMQEQLKSARFRYLNEQLYSGSGALAYKLFKNDEDSFRVYHEGFQSQVSKWPDNPLDRIIQYVRESRSSSVVADFGCGDAKLGESVPQKVFSFDLVALKPHVTACDMAHVPLKAGTVDICVFCLSLMGTNLLDYLLEAHRVLKLEGMLLIAEVISRFENISSFIRKLEKLGFILINKDTTSKMFVFFELKKKANYDKTMLPEITLEPCVYKKR